LIRNKWNRFVRAAAGVMGAGVLLQTTGCDPTGLLTQWAVSIASDFFTSFFYDWLNVQQPFVF
jgi:hypothetical protein